MHKLDLRQLGTVLGLPLYLDVASVRRDRDRDAKEALSQTILRKAVGMPQDMGEVSDGYHTFNELYRYRMLYNALAFEALKYVPSAMPHKSRFHSDGEPCFGGGWFIVVAYLPVKDKLLQISNHYEEKYWNLFDIEERIRADEWDGHTPEQAAERMEAYLTWR